MNRTKPEPEPADTGYGHNLTIQEVRLVNLFRALPCDDLRASVLPVIEKYVPAGRSSRRRLPGMDAS